MSTKNLIGRLVALLVALIMAVSLFAGCKGGAGGAEKSTSEAGSSKASVQPADTQTVEAKTLPEAVITFYFPGDMLKDQRKVWDEVEKKAKDSINVKLDFNYIPWDDYRNKIQVLTSSGDEYEANFDASWCCFTQIANKGGYMDIKDLLPNVAPKLYQMYQEYDPNFLKLAQINGQLVSLPAMLYFGPQHNFVTLREDLKKKYNVPDISKIEDYEVYLKTIKENEKGIIPCVINREDGFMWPFTYKHGYVIANRELELVYKRDDPKAAIVPWEQTEAFKDMVETVNRWYKSGYTQKDVMTNSGESYENRFRNGNAASYIQFFRDENKYIKGSHPDWESKAYCLYPEAPVPMPDILGNMMAFNKGGDQTERALMFMQWLYESQENYDLFLFGNKGEHYELDGDMFKSANGITMDKNAYLQWFPDWGFKNKKFWRFSADDGKEYNENYVKFADAEQRVAYPHIGFNFVSDNVKNEVAKRTDAYKQYGLAMGCGVLGADQIDSYVNRQKKAGIDKIITEYQKQLDAYIAGK